MTQFLRMFPGERDYKEVSEREWDAPIPHPDKDGWGNVLALTADVRVWDRPGGKLLVAKKWPSRSFIRNFARIMKMLFSNVNENVLKFDAASFPTALTMSGAGGAGLVPNRTTQLQTGAGMAVGDGASSEDHTRNDLVSRVGGIIVANGSVATTVDSAATLTLQITQGITIAQSGGITAREIALFLFLFNQATFDLNAAGHASLMAYDGISDTPVAQGGVIAPRYTMDFPV